MDSDTLLVYGRETDAPPLREILAALSESGRPVSLGVSIAGAASDEELDANEWDAAIVRWLEPELHDAWMIARYIPGTDDEADAAISIARGQVTGVTDEVGRLIVLDHLSRTRAVYAFDVAPPMIDDSDHDAWDALDTALRQVAALTDGLIYAGSDGYFDSDGELILATTADED